MATGVKEADIWAAADALLHAGEQPTIERVRLHLGRGSPNTVGPHLKTWFRGLSERLVAGQGGESGTPEAVTRAIGQVWEAALAAAREEWTAAVALERAEIIKAQESLDVGRATLEQAQDRLQTREADLQASTQAAHAQTAATEARLQASEQMLRENALELKDTQSQLSLMREQTNALQQALQSAQTTHQEALAAAETRHVAHERRWLGEIDEQRQALKKAHDENEHARKAAAFAVMDHQTALRQIRAERDTQAQRAAQAEAGVQTLNAQLEMSIQAVHSTRAHGEGIAMQLKAQIVTLHEQLAAKDRQIEQIMQMTKRSVATPIESDASGTHE